MGNSNSLLKNKESTSKQLKEWSMVENVESIFGNDYNEYIDRQHMHHFLRKYIFQGNFSAPMEEKLIQGCDVLDVGCGPGTWLLDLSNKYTNSRFYGLDIKPLFPQKIKPSNLQFIEADIFNGLPFCDNKFDFVHIETMSVEIMRDQWNFVFSELIRVVKPGGYIESTESVHVEVKDENLVTSKFQQIFCDALLKQNIDIKLTYNIDSIIESQQNVGKVYREEKSFLYGPKGGKIGLAYQDVMYSFYTGKTTIIESFINEIGMTEEEYKNMLENVKEEFKQFDVRGRLVRLWTQKIINNNY